MTGFTNLFQFVASGSILWIALLVVFGLAFLLIIEFPILSKIVSVILSWPFTVVGGWISRTKIGQKLMATRAWVWLEKKEFDPKAHPLSWWAVRGVFVLCLWAFSLAYMQVNTRPDPATQPLALFGKERIETAWKDRAMRCEDRLAEIPPPVENVKVAPAPMIVTIPGLPASGLAPVDLKTKGKGHKKAEKTWIEKQLGL